MRPLLLGLFLLTASAAQARAPKDFVAPQEKTEEELAASKQRSKEAIELYAKDIPHDTKPFPWKAVALMGLVMVAAAPFALRMYKNTIDEIEGTNAVGARAPKE